MEAKISKSWDVKKKIQWMDDFFEKDGKFGKINKYRTNI